MGIIWLCSTLSNSQWPISSPSGTTGYMMKSARLSMDSGHLERRLGVGTEPSTYSLDSECTGLCLEDHAEPCHGPHHLGLAVLLHDAPQGDDKVPGSGLQSEERFSQAPGSWAGTRDHDAQDSAHLPSLQRRKKGRSFKKPGIRKGLPKAGKEQRSLSTENGLLRDRRGKGLC